MEYIILGLLFQVVFFCAVIGAFIIGKRTALKPIHKPEVDEKEQQRRKEFDQHFKRMFNYDVDVAYGKKVSE